MIPNSAPMAAVYLRPAATGSRDGKLFSRPVVAWSEGAGLPLVAADSNRLVQAGTYDGIKFLGLWQHGWSPSQDEMASLLPERIPGSPNPLAINVVIRETASGWWAAHRETDGRMITQAIDIDTVKSKLSVLGTYHVTNVIPLHDS